MPVVTALVGPPLVHRAVGQIGGLVHGQAIEVGPQRDAGGVGIRLGVEIGDQARAGAVPGLVPVLPQPRTNDALGAVLLEAQLGVLVEVVAYLTQSREQGQQPLGRWVGHRGRG